MKSFLEEYGFAILAAIVIILLIAMASPLGDIIRTQLSNIVNKFANSANKKLDAADAGDATAVLAGGKLTITANSTTDTFKYILHGIKGGSEVKTDATGAVGTAAYAPTTHADGSYVSTADVNYSESAAVKDNKLELDKGSEYYVEVINTGTQEVFYSNRVVVK